MVIESLLLNQNSVFHMELISVEVLRDLLITYAPRVVGALLTLIIGFWVIGWVSRLVKKALEKRDLEEGVRTFLASLVSIGLKVLLLLSVASMFGIATTSFVAIFGALTLAVGMALQGNLGHFASGVLILVFKPYRVGDFIVTQGYSGTVREIQMFNTTLTALDNRIIFVPNGAITSGPIENITMLGERRLDLTFGIGYSDDIDKARGIIERVLKSAPNALLDKGYDIFVKELADSSVNFGVRFWTAVPDYWPAFTYMQENIKKEFDREGINIPFPQMDVHVQQNA